MAKKPPERPERPQPPVNGPSLIFQKKVLDSLDRIEKSLLLIDNKLDNLSESLQTIDNKVDLLIAKVDECCEEEEHPPPTGVRITQKGADMAITGVNVGGSEVFVANAVPEGTVFPSGTVDTWTASDPSIGVKPANDPTTDPGESAVVVSVPADSTLDSFDLTVSVQMPADANGNKPEPLTNTASVPVIKAPAPLPTGVVINQMPRAKK